MTKRKANPQKRGRKRVPQFTYRLLRARWERFQHETSARGLSAPDLAAAFIRENQGWCRAHKINPGQYTSLKNDLSKGKQGRERKLEWRRNCLLYIRAAHAEALGISPFPGFIFDRPVALGKHLLSRITVTIVG